MGDNFVLSDKVVFGYEGSMVRGKHIIEFIRRLKENFCGENHVGREINEQIINELAGSKFNGGKTNE